MTQSISVIDVASGRKVTVADAYEVAPGIFGGKFPREALPRFGLVEFVPRHDGTYAARLLQFGRYVQLSRHSDPLGIGIGRNTLLRLARAGFIDYIQPSPGAIRISIDSLLRHLEATSEPGYWTIERVERFRTARLDDGCAACPGRRRKP